MRQGGCATRAQKKSPWDSRESIPLFISSICLKYSPADHRGDEPDCLFCKSARGGEPLEHFSGPAAGAVMPASNRARSPRESHLPPLIRLAPDPPWNRPAACHYRGRPAGLTPITCGGRCPCSTKKSAKNAHCGAQNLRFAHREAMCSEPVAASYTLTWLPGVGCWPILGPCRNMNRRPDFRRSL